MQPTRLRLEAWKERIHLNVLMNRDTKNPHLAGLGRGLSDQSKMYARAMPIGRPTITHGLLQDSMTHSRYPGSKA